MMLLLVLLQVADPPRINFDLGKFKPSNDSCAPGSAQLSEIIVCARKWNRDIVGRDVAEEGLLPKAELGLFGKVRGAIATEQSSVGGFPSSRVKATVKIPF